MAVQTRLWELDHEVVFLVCLELETRRRVPVRKPCGQKALRIPYLWGRIWTGIEAGVIGGWCCSS